MKFIARRRVMVKSKPKVNTNKNVQGYDMVNINVIEKF